MKYKISEHSELVKSDGQNLDEFRQNVLIKSISNQPGSVKKNYMELLSIF